MSKNIFVTKKEETKGAKVFRPGGVQDIVKRNMKKLRKEKNLTLRQMGKVVGKSLQHYQRVESGDKSPNLVILDNLCLRFNLHPSYFFADEGLAIIHEDGTVMADDITVDDIYMLRAFSKLSEENKQAITKYLKFLLK